MVSAIPVHSQEAGDLGEPVARSGSSPQRPEPDQPKDEPSRSLFDHGDPTAYEQLMLEMVNRARANPGAEAARLGINLNDGLTAGTIQDSAKQPLAFHARLIQAARVHSQWMLDADTFSHTGNNNSSPGTRMTDAGYVFSGSWTWGENIAWGGTTGSPDLEAYTIARHDALFRSAGHRQNICNGSFDEVGLGVLSGKFTTTSEWNAVMASQDFAKSSWSPGPLLVGVIFADTDGDGFYDPGEGIPGVTVSPDGDWYAISSASGGYAVPYVGTSGPLSVTLSGNALSIPVQSAVTKTGSNLKLDFILPIASAARFVDRTMSFSQASGMTVQVSGPMGAQFDLQHSTNLKDWSTISSHTLSNFMMTLTHQPGNGIGCGYYRLR